MNLRNWIVCGNMGRALARMWYEKAAAEGYEGAAEALETLCNED